MTNEEKDVFGAPVPPGKIEVAEEVLEEHVEEEIKKDVLFDLNSRPVVWEAVVAAFQHVTAVFVGIITPPLLISKALGLELHDSVHIISMSLVVSGIATFIQCKRIGPIGSGLLSVQGTSFTFLGPIIATGVALTKGGMEPTGALAVIFGICLLGSPIEMILSRFLGYAQKVITPLVTGIVVTLIGCTLVKVGAITMCGGFDAKTTGQFASLQNLGLAFGVLFIIVILNRSKNPYIRMSSIIIGLVVGYVVAAFMGLVEFGKLKELEAFSVPTPFKYGIAFSWTAFLPIALLYLITTVETIGDITATSSVSGEPVAGDVYFRRLRGGVLGDGVNSALAAVFNTFPNTTFSQNNGVIQLTGVASRYVGYFIAGFLVLFGLFPVVGGVFQLMPQAVLGGATIIMFGTVGAAGIRIISSRTLDGRGVLILAVSLAMGLGVTFVPEMLDNLPSILQNIFQSGIATGGIFAIVLNIILPRPKDKAPVPPPLEEQR
jgi:xanthine permease XanP